MNAAVIIIYKDKQKIVPLYMIDYDVMVFVRTRSFICDHIIWFDNECEIGIMPFSLYKNLRDLLIGKGLTDISEIQLIRPKVA